MFRPFWVIVIGLQVITDITGAQCTPAQTYQRLEGIAAIIVRLV